MLWSGPDGCGATGLWLAESVGCYLLDEIRLQRLKDDSAFILPARQNAAFAAFDGNGFLLARGVDIQRAAFHHASINSLGSGRAALHIGEPEDTVENGCDCGSIRLGGQIKCIAFAE